MEKVIGKESQSITFPPGMQFGWLAMHRSVFQRMAASENKKRRSSLFDISLKELASTLAPVVNLALAHRLEAPPVLPMAAARGVPDFHGISYMSFWNAAGNYGRGLRGVLEANFVEPTHDKQGFECTIVLSRLEARLVHMQKSYCRSLEMSRLRVVDLQYERGRCKSPGNRVVPRE